MGKHKYFHSPTTQFRKTSFISLDRIFVEVLSRISILQKNQNGYSEIKQN